MSLAACQTSCIFVEANLRASSSLIAPFKRSKATLNETGGTVLVVEAITGPLTLQLARNWDNAKGVPRRVMTEVVVDSRFDLERGNYNEIAEYMLMRSPAGRSEGEQRVAAQIRGCVNGYA